MKSGLANLVILLVLIVAAAVPAMAQVGAGVSSSLPAASPMRALGARAAMDSTGERAYYSLDEGKGSLAADAWNGLDASVVDVAWSGPTDGYNGSPCLVFGAPGKLVLPEAVLGNLDTGTFMCWIYPTQRQDHSYIISKASPDLIVYFSLFLDAAGLVQTNIYGGSNFDSAEPSAYQVPLNAWTHVALVWGDGQATLYVNAAPVRTGRLDYLGSTTSAKTYVGRDVTNPDQAFPGRIDDIRVWSRALSADEIAKFAGAGGFQTGSFYVDAAAGDDATGDGSADKPWRSIAYAMGVVGAFASESRVFTINLAAGTYDEAVQFVPFITLKGADHAHPEATVLQHFGGPSDNVVVKAAQGTKLEDLKVTLPSSEIASEVTLVEIDNVAMELSSVVLDGADVALSTALRVSEAGSNAAYVHDCQFLRVNNGIVATGTAMKVARNLFDQIHGDAVFIWSAKQAGDGATPNLGDKTQTDTTGFNRFRTVAGLLVKSVVTAVVKAELNDWGVYTAPEVQAQVTGQVDTQHFIAKSLGPSSVAVTVNDGSTGQPLATKIPCTVVITSLNATAEQDTTSGLYVFPAVPPGGYDVNGSATGYGSGSAKVNVDGMGVVPVTLTLSDSSTGTGGGCRKGTGGSAKASLGDMGLWGVISMAFLARGTRRRKRP